MTSIKIPQNAILVSIDVSSLYTSIPHKDGIAACAQALQDNTDTDPLRSPIEILVEMLNIALCTNCQSDFLRPVWADYLLPLLHGQWLAPVERRRRLLPPTESGSRNQPPQGQVQVCVLPPLWGQYWRGNDTIQGSFVNEAILASQTCEVWFQGVGHGWCD